MVDGRIVVHPSITASTDDQDVYRHQHHVERTSAGRSMATRPSPTGPWACRPRRRLAGVRPDPLAATHKAG
jgi:hypothetical protein